MVIEHMDKEIFQGIYMSSVYMNIRLINSAKVEICEKYKQVLPTTG